MGRLIDADALKQDFRKYQIKSLIAHTEEKNVFDVINEQPTAYDVEKVVAELEKEKEIHTNYYNISIYKDFPEIKQRYKQICGVIKKAIDIVKRGGLV